MGLDMEVLSLTTPGLHDLGPESVDLARRINESAGRDGGTASGTLPGDGGPARRPYLGRSGFERVGPSLPRVPAKTMRGAYYSGFAPEVDTAFATYDLSWHYDARQPVPVPRPVQPV